MQYEVWLDQMLTPQQASYTIGGWLEFEGHVELDVWERAISELVARHDALRLILMEGAPVPVQRVLEPWVFELARHDYSDRSDGLVLPIGQGHSASTVRARTLRVGQRLEAELTATNTPRLAAVGVARGDSRAGLVPPWIAKSQRFLAINTAQLYSLFGRWNRFLTTWNGCSAAAPNDSLARECKPLAQGVKTVAATFPY